MSEAFKPLIIIGGGGHASVIVDILRAQNRKILAVICPETSVQQREAFRGLRQLLTDDDIDEFSPSEVLLVNGIGMLPRSSIRQQVSQSFIEKGYHFETVIASDALISPLAKIGQGVQILSGVIIQAGVVIKNHSVINSGVIVEHDCNVGEYNHLAPRATLCGQVSSGSNVYIGAGSTIIQNIIIADDCVVGAGAVVTKSVQTGQTCYPSRSVVK